MTLTGLLYLPIPESQGTRELFFCAFGLFFCVKTCPNNFPSLLSQSRGCKFLHNDLRRAKIRDPVVFEVEKVDKTTGVRRKKHCERFGILSSTPCSIRRGARRFQTVSFPRETHPSGRRSILQARGSPLCFSSSQSKETKDAGGVLHHPRCHRALLGARQGFRQVHRVRSSRRRAFTARRRRGSRGRRGGFRARLRRLHQGEERSHREGPLRLRPRDVP